VAIARLKPTNTIQYQKRGKYHKYQAFITQDKLFITSVSKFEYINCTKVPRCVEEFMVNSIKFKRIISKLVVFPKVSHIFA